jgi:small subunit ribosomal protein S6
MPTYETIFITPPNLTEDDERTTVETLSQVITSGGGTLAAQDRMGRRRLAYPIKKHEDGVYIRLLYDSEAEVPKELERRFRLSDRVLRYLTVHLDPEWAQYEKEEAVREAKRRAEAEAAEAARQQAAREEAAAKEAREREERDAAETVSEESDPESAEPPADPAPLETAPADGEDDDGEASGSSPEPENATPQA